MAALRAALLAMVGALVLAGCGGAGAPDAVVRGEALAALDIVDTVTEWHGSDAPAFVAAIDGQDLDSGDLVRTDDTGFAEVVYADGSLTRLAPQTEFEVIGLGGDTTVPEVRIRLEAGRVWNRVNSVTGTRGRFEVETSVGVAAVRGTAFLVECLEPEVCTFSVFEGLVEITTLDGRVIAVAAGETVTLGARDDDTAGGPEVGGSDASPDTVGSGTDDGGTSPPSDDDEASVDHAGAEPGSEATGADGEAAAGALGTSDADGSDHGGDGPLATTVAELDRGSLDLASPGGLWLGSNVRRDDELGRFGRLNESCSVSLAGRNLDHADTPETAIPLDVSQTATISAVATGDVERYEVRLRMAGLEVQAAEGEVLADEQGDRSSFRGSVDVGDYAQWGVGLYEVRGSTTGTACDVQAFVRVTGRNPLTTGVGIAGLLLTLGGLAGAITAIRTVTAASSPAVGTSTTPSAATPATDSTADSQTTTRASSTTTDTSFLQRVVDTLKFWQ